MQSNFPVSITQLDALLKTALMEDIGAGDITSDLVIPEHAESEMVFAAREPLVVCGLPILQRLFELGGESKLKVNVFTEDGTHALKGTALMTVRGNARRILMLERTALNIIQHLSGIATLTHAFVEEVFGTRAKILDTRKTIPGLRELQKYAVRMGGGVNHRMRLDNGILIKDNHIQAAGGITAAVNQARAGAEAWILKRLGPNQEGSLTQYAQHKRSANDVAIVEVECDTLEQVEEALAADADVLLLDNMDLPTLRKAVKLVNGRSLTQASGGVTLATARQISETGVDFISIGALTHSAKAADIGLDVVG
jgi:nicotinate-nucleotide pyrophosphorylase (carboxylating)